MGVTRPYAAIPLQLHLPRELPCTAIGGAILQPELPSCVSKQGQHQGELRCSDSSGSYREVPTVCNVSVPRAVWASQISGPLEVRSPQARIRNLQQHAGTGAIRQEKTPTENGWGFIIGGGGGNRTRVRRHSMPGTTCLARCSISDDGNTTCEAHRRPHPLDFGAGWRVAAGTYPVIMTLHPRAQAQVGSGLGLKRPERSCRRWQL